MSSDNGVSFLLDFDEHLVIVDLLEMTRTTTFGASVHTSDNSESGTITVEGTEYLEIGQKTRILSQRIIAKANTKTDRGTRDASEVLLSEMNPPVEWVLDRTDLDRNHPGDILLQQTYDVHFTGSEDITIDGQRETGPIDEGISTVTEVWNVVEKHESLGVQGNDYRNVIEIERKMSGYEDNEDLEIVYVYWVAKGIGVVKSVNVLPVSDLFKNITIELVDTNLIPEM